MQSGKGLYPGMGIAGNGFPSDGQGTAGNNYALLLIWNSRRKIPRKAFGDFHTTICMMVSPFRNARMIKKIHFGAKKVFF